MAAPDTANGDAGSRDTGNGDTGDGWVHWSHGRNGFNSVLGRLDVRLDPAAPGSHALVRWNPGDAHVNLIGVVHGGAMATAIDVALFSAGTLLGIIRPGFATTVELSIQYLGGARTGTPVMIEVELARAATRLLFFRGLVRQEAAAETSDAGASDEGASADVSVAAFTAIVRRSAPDPVTGAGDETARSAPAAPA